MRVALVIVLLVTVVAAVAVVLATRAPGSSFRGFLSAPTAEERELANVIRRDVEALTALAPRNVIVPANLSAAASLIESRFREAGYTAAKQTYEVETIPCHNLEIEIRGASRPDEILIVGAHYDSVPETPGADDNASGVAALLSIARALRGTRPARTIRLVAFVNEEPPFFKSERMGSWIYANRSHGRGERIVGMLSLETIGYYDARPGTQQYPEPLSTRYPSTGDFIAFAGNVASRALVHDAIASFRRHARFPSEAATLPQLIEEIGWSDQWSFWQFGYPALMVTDTALFRNPHYHRPSDLPHTLDYDRLARVTAGLVAVVRDLSQ